MGELANHTNPAGREQDGLGLKGGCNMIGLTESHSKKDDLFC
jgi:hypothetical protein